MIRSCIIWVCVLASLSSEAFAQSATQSEIHALFVVMTDQADLSPDSLPCSGLVGRESKSCRGREVHRRLTEVAESAQTGSAFSEQSLIEQLEQDGVDYRRFWIINAVLVYGTEELGSQLRTRPDVLDVRIDANPESVPLYQFEIPVDDGTEPAFEASCETGPAEPYPDAVRGWNLNRIGAPEAWEFGATGRGITVGFVDSGADWQHPALKRQYRGFDCGGNPAKHDYNWFAPKYRDSVGAAANGLCSGSAPPSWCFSAEPKDNLVMSVHGTAVTGIVAGNDPDRRRTVGVAPNASWMACQVGDSSGNGGLPAMLECLQFMLAPTKLDGSAPRAEAAPDIVNVSWGCFTAARNDGTYEAEQLCAEAGQLGLEHAVAALHAAGILFVAAAGDDKGCDAIADPPATVEAALVVGATNLRDEVATFAPSSRGGAASGFRPDVMAPQWVASTNGHDGYTLFMGTSAAAPHVAGQAALLWSADESLIGEVELTMELIRQTADPLMEADVCGDSGDADYDPHAAGNYSWGWGRINASHAVQWIVDQSFIVVERPSVDLGSTLQGW